MSRALAAAGLAALVLIAACETPDVPTDPPLEPGLDAQLRQSLSAAGVIPIEPMAPQEPALVDLGRALLFDKILSGNRDISCATCHDPLGHGTDGLSLAIGTGGVGQGSARTLGPGRQFVPRNAPTLMNTGLRAQYVLWDGRVSGFQSGPFTSPKDVVLPFGLPNILAAQAMLPVLNRREMRGEPGDTDVFGQPNELAQLADSQYVQVWEAIMNRLLAIPAYRDKFSAAFPNLSPGALGFRHAATAIAAALMQDWIRDDSPFERYLHREDGALSPDAKQGAVLFFGRARCSSCHRGPLLGGQSFANVGVPQLGPGTGKAAPLDIGRGEIEQVNGPPGPPPSGRFTFRVVPLRNVELTAPYFHDGAYPTLEAVVRHYNNVTAAQHGYDVTQLAPELRSLYHGDETTKADVLTNVAFQLRQPLQLSDTERSDLVAFLKSLTDPAARDLSALVPASVPSGLPVR